MTQAAKVALLVGAGDAIGAAVARRFAHAAASRSVSLDGKRQNHWRWSKGSDRTVAR